MRTIGIIVNPVAGLGGPLALKGSDHLISPIWEISPVVMARVMRTLSFLKSVAGRFRLITCIGPMGESSVKGAHLACEVLPLRIEPPTTSLMTKAAARALMEHDADLIVFAGGDGTARDIVEVVGQSVPLLGIPCGVKMHSAVFATTPETAGRLLRDIVEGRDTVHLRQSEVLDIDEFQLTSNRVTAHLFGYAMTPYERHLVQSAKSGGAIGDDVELQGAAREIAAEMQPGVTYLIGPGTSTNLVLSELVVQGTLLGVDAIRDGVLIGADLDATAIRKHSEQSPLRIILGITGGQGFVLGRGNQQIPADIIRKEGWANIIVIAGATKLARLTGGRLHIDTGDPETDADMAGYIRVHTGPGRLAMLRVSS